MPAAQGQEASEALHSQRFGEHREEQAVVEQQPEHTDQLVWTPRKQAILII